MVGKVSILLVAVAVAVFAQKDQPHKRKAPSADSADKDQPHKLRAWFADGTGVEFEQETTGSTVLAMHGGGLTVDDHGTERIVEDKNGNILYGYGVEAWAGPQAGTVTIRIKPLAKESQARHKEPIGTVAGVREFPGIRKGQAVQLEILYNPSTGEKIYDILRPSTDATPELWRQGTRAADAELAGQELSFREIALVVNGEKTGAPAGWLTGAVARLYLPGRGAYFLSTYQPKTYQTFRPVVYVDRHNLEFAMDGDFIRITSNGNVLTQAETAILWVYHDPKYQPQSQTDKADVVFADKVESLLTRQ